MYLLKFWISVTPWQSSIFLTERDKEQDRKHLRLESHKRNFHWLSLQSFLFLLLRILYRPWKQNTTFSRSRTSFASLKYTPQALLCRSWFCSITAEKSECILEWTCSALSSALLFWQLHPTHSLSRAEVFVYRAYFRSLCDVFSFSPDDVIIPFVQGQLLRACSGLHSDLFG